MASPDGFKWGLGVGHQNELQAPGRHNQVQNAFNVLKTFDPSLNGGVQAQSYASNQNVST